MRHAVKIIVKVLAVVVVVAIATPYLFGFASGLFNSLSAGYIASSLVVCIGFFAIGHIIFNDMRRLRGGMKKHSGGAKCGKP